MKMKVTITLIAGLMHIMSFASNSPDSFQDNVKEFRKAVANNNARLALGHYQNMQTLNQKKATEFALITTGFTDLLQRANKNIKNEFAKTISQAKNSESKDLLFKITRATTLKGNLKRAFDKFQSNQQKHTKSNTQASTQQKNIKVRTLDNHTFIIPPERYKHFEMLAGCVEGTDYYQQVDRSTIPLENISAPCLEFLLNLAPHHEDDQTVKEKLKTIDLKTKKGKDLLAELVYASDYLLAPRSIANAIATYAYYNGLLNPNTFPHDGIRIIAKIEKDLSISKGKWVAPLLCTFGDAPYAHHLATILPKQDALVLAARHNLVDVVKQCIEDNVDINAGMTNSKDTTALKQCVVSSNVEIAELLLQHKAKIQNTWIASCWLQHLNDFDKDELDNQLRSRGKILDLLIEAGASLEEENYDDATPLITACQYYGPEQALMLLEKGAQVNVQNNYGKTPLYFACKRGNVALVKELIAKGADISNSEDVLANACENKDAEVPIYLINEQKLKPSERHLRLAVKHENIKLAQFLLKKECAYTKENLSTYLYEALNNKKHKSVDFLIKQGASINQVDESGYTPLSTASRGLNITMVRSCLTLKADVNQSDAQGKFPLIEELKPIPTTDREQEGLRKKRTKMVNILLQANADPNKECSWSHRRALDLAIQTAPELVQTLLKHGADPNYTCAGTNVCSDKESCLNYAIRLLPHNGWEGYVPNTLIPLIKKTNNKKHLYQAMSCLLRRFFPARLATQEASNIIKELVLAGMDLKETDTEGNTLLIQLLQKTLNGEDGSWPKEIVKLIDLFVQRGADINHRNKDGKSALRIALSFHKYSSWMIRPRNAFITEKNYQAVQHLIKLGAQIDGQITDQCTSINGLGANEKINQLLTKTLHKQYSEAAARQQANILKMNNENANQSEEDNNDQEWCTIA